MELLAPAGSWEALVAAVQNGADAVYFGGKSFNARQYAGNFDDEQLKNAVEYCHVRGVNVYITLNTLLNDRELEKLPDFIVYLHNIGADAIIVQDIGVARLIREIIPGMSLHASTQMAVHNLAGVKQLEKTGFERVVLARELNRQEIQHICQNTSLEIEVFVHGALCMSYSGQCLMSSMIGGRSGNRGRCAQPCRLPYGLIDIDSGKVIHNDPKRQHLLSPKDLSLIEYLDELKEAGVRSLKIEGRMKRPEYVAVVVKKYNDYLNSGLKLQPEDYDDLLKVFNRGGFTQGYFEDKLGERMMSYAKPKNWGVHIGDVEAYNRKKNIVAIRLKGRLNIGDGIEIWTKQEQDPGTVVDKLWINQSESTSAQAGQVVTVSIGGSIERGDKVYKTSDIQLLETAKQSFNGSINIRSVPVYGSCKLKENEPLSLSIWDDDGNYIETAGEKPAEAAINRGVGQEKLLEQFNKLGGTPYRFQNIGFDIEPGLALPVSEINNVRRSAIEQLEQQRIKKYIPDRIDVRDVKVSMDKLIDYTHFQPYQQQTRLAVQVDYYEQAEELTDIGIDRFYFSSQIFAKENNNENFRNLIKRCISREIDIFLVLPRIIRDKDLKYYKELMSRTEEYAIKGILLSNIGHIQLAKDFGYDEIYGDFGLNVFNSFSALYCRELGIKGITLSPELTSGQIRDIRRYQNFEEEMIVYGRLPLMILQNCPIGSLSSYVDKDERCNCEHKSYGLIDRKGMTFPLRTGRLTCQTELLNSQPIFLADKMNEILLTKVSRMRLSFTTENSSRCREVAAIYQDALQLGAVKAVEQHKAVIDHIMMEGFTRGHYYRGVE